MKLLIPLIAIVALLPEETSGFMHITGRSKDSVILAFSAFQPKRESGFDFHGAFTAKHFNSDAILIRDTENLWYQGGTNGAFGGMTEIFAYLRKHIQPYKKVLAIGASMGGYAALAAMAQMPKISACLAIAPQTFIDMENRRKNGDYRWADRMKIINNAMKPTPFSDLHELYKKSYNGKRPAYILYGAKTKIDRIHAMRMKDIPGVKLYQLADSDHFVGLALKEKGIFHKVIDQLITKNTLAVPNDKTLLLVK